MFMAYQYHGVPHRLKLWRPAKRHTYKIMIRRPALFTLTTLDVVAFFFFFFVSACLDFVNRER